MKTFIVGDLHLQSQKILPIIKPLLIENKIEQIIFIGDYVDQWGQTGNDSLYISEINTLLNFKEWCHEQNIKVIYLLGNHDVIYLIDSCKIYTSDSRKIRYQVAQMLLELEPTLSVNVHGYQLSHAGFAKNLQVSNDLSIKHLQTLENMVGPGSGGSNPYGSEIWLRPEELEKYPSKNYSKQIFGHTPVKTININENNINVDTFSLKRNLKPIGDGSILYIDSETIKKIKTNWDKIEHSKF